MTDASLPYPTAGGVEDFLAPGVCPDVKSLIPTLLAVHAILEEIPKSVSHDHYSRKG